MQKNISIILSSKNRTGRIEKVLLGYNNQTYRNFEIIVIYSDNNQEIHKEIEKVRDEVFYTIKEVFLQGNSLSVDNLLTNIDTEYLLFADAGCIPRFDFVEQHIKNREEGFFLAGATNNVSDDVFNKISRNDIYSGNCFEPVWLRNNGSTVTLQDKVRYSKGLLGALLNGIASSTVKFNSENASVWKKDLHSKIDFSGADFFENLSQHLKNNNIKGRQIKYSTVLIG